MTADNGHSVNCDAMADAIKFGYVVEVQGELMLPLRKLTDVNPDATAGNVLTGETYDPDEFSMAMAITYCPFCGAPLTSEDDYLAGYLEDEDL